MHLLGGKPLWVCVQLVFVLKGAAVNCIIMKIHLDLFSGTGGFAKGLFNAGFNFDKHYFSEIDKHAIANYKYNFKDAEYSGAIQDVSGRNIERPDIITFGFPCQDLSIAGKRKGLEGKRSGLYFEAMRIIEDTKPSVFIFENVKGLLSSNEGKDFEIVLRTIADIGLYECEWQLLNTSWFLPQNRERIYFIGHLRGKSRPKVFPIRETIKNNEINNEMIFIGGVMGDKNKKWLEDGKDNSRNFPQGQRIYSTEGISAQLNAQGGGWGAKTGLYAININGKTHQQDAIQNENGIANSLVVGSHSNSSHFTKTQTKAGIRRLTPKECERLQGFPDDWTKFGNYDGTEKIISESQRYKLLGNAVTVNVVKEIGSRLLAVAPFNTKTNCT